MSIERLQQRQSELTWRLAKAVGNTQSINDSIKFSKKQLKKWEKEVSKLHHKLDMVTQNLNYYVDEEPEPISLESIREKKRIQEEAKNTISNSKEPLL